MAKRTETARACLNCGDAIGPSTNDLGVTTRDDDGSGVGKTEHWCSQCFVWIRAPKSPERWYWPALVAQCCGNCSRLTVNFTGPGCQQCKSRSTVILPAKVVVDRVQHAPSSQIAKAAARAT